MADVGPVDEVKKACECSHCKGVDVKPYRVVLMCPNCGLPHVDLGEWATKPHRRHKCVDYFSVYDAPDPTDASKTLRAGTSFVGCGFEWQPALVYTVGIAP